MFTRFSVRAITLLTLSLSPAVCFAKTPITSGFHNLEVKELNGGTGTSINANISFSNSTPLGTATTPPPAYIVGEDHVGGVWRTISGPSKCEDWEPSTDTVNFNHPFTQTQLCDTIRERDVQVYNIWSDGNRTPKYVYVEQQDDGVESSRSALGTKHYITGQSANYTPWANSGGLYSCSAWSPSTSSVNQGQSFTQTSSCSQNQSRVKNTFNNWTDGRTDLVSSETLTQVVKTTQTRSATGTKVTEECRAVVRSYYTFGSRGNAGAVWAGERIANTLLLETWTRIGGYEYKRGARISYGEYLIEFGICRRPAQ